MEFLIIAGAKIVALRINLAAGCATGGFTAGRDWLALVA
jgi:hypothetical protein